MLQKHDWDCGVCCVAMSQACTWDEAIVMLKRAGWIEGPMFGSHIARATGSLLKNSRSYGGTLERCIIQVSDDAKKMPFHWVWSDNGLHCPAKHFTNWGNIKSIGQILICGR